MAWNPLDILEDEHKHKRDTVSAQGPASWVPPNICVGKKEANAQAGPVL